MGYVEGRNLHVERRYSTARVERLDALAAELVQLKVDVLVAWPVAATQAAQRATRTIPIVFPISGDPVGYDLVASLARPGANVTGVSMQLSDFRSKLLELLKEALPQVTRIAVLMEAEMGQKAATLAWVDAATRAVGILPQVVEWRVPADLERAFETAVGGRADALLVLEAFRTFEYRHRIVQLTTGRRLPAVFFWREYVKLGGLMAYGPNVSGMFRRSATYVHRILSGARPEDLPVEQPTVFDLSINLKTAKALGLTIPRSILIRATTVIE